MRFGIVQVNMPMLNTMRISLDDKLKQKASKQHDTRQIICLGIDMWHQMHKYNSQQVRTCKGQHQFHGVEAFELECIAQNTTGKWHRKKQYEIERVQLLIWDCNIKRLTRLPPT